MLLMLEFGQRMPTPLVPFAQLTMSNSRTWVAAPAPLDCTPMVRLAMLRRNRLRPWLPTHDTVAAMLPGSSCWTESVSWYTFSGSVYSLAYARGWYERLFGLLVKFSRIRSGFT